MDTMLERFHRFSTVVFSASQDIQKLERDEMERYGLKGTFAQYLLILSRFPQGLTAAQICSKSGKDKAAVSRTLAEMEQKNLITREPANGAYRARILLTGEGMNAALFVARRVNTAVELAGEGLSEEDRQIFYAALNRVSHNLQTIASKGLPPEAELSEKI